MYRLIQGCLCASVNSAHARGGMLDVYVKSAHAREWGVWVFLLTFDMHVEGCFDVYVNSAHARARGEWPCFQLILDRRFFLPWSETHEPRLRRIRGLKTFGRASQLGATQTNRY